MKAIHYSDTQLVEMIKTGGVIRERAFQFLIEKEKREKKLDRILKNKGAKPEEIEEIINEALIALYTSIVKDSFRQGGSVQAYLVGASKNIWNKMWAKQSRLGIKVDFESLYFPDTELNAEAHVIKRDQRLELVSYFNKLSEACKTILKLAFFEERTNKEIVNIMGYKDNLVVSSKKSKCLHKLIEIIKDRKSKLTIG